MRIALAYLLIEISVIEAVEAICFFAGTVALAVYAYMEYHDCPPAVPPPIPGPSQQDNDNGNARRRVPQFPIEEYYNREYYPNPAYFRHSSGSNSAHPVYYDAYSDD